MTLTQEMKEDIVKLLTEYLEAGPEMCLVRTERLYDGGACAIDQAYRMLTIELKVPETNLPLKKAG